MVEKILKEEQYEPTGLMLELTERCKEMEFELLSERVEELKRTGVRVALDDMGTGFSTIDLLLHLNADEIKLDMNFTRNLRGVEKHEILTRTLCMTAERNQVDICFEGVEDKEYEIITVGVPDVNSLDKAQADIFYLTLLDIILEYYKDHPEEKS